MREHLKDKERLNHIIDAIDRIIRYTAGKTHSDIVEDDMMYYAIVKNIEIIGEAANMLTNQFVEIHSETPWKRIRGMRNYIVHEYFQIDDSVVWSVIQNDLQPLRQQVERYLAETDWQQWEQNE